MQPTTKTSFGFSTPKVQSEFSWRRSKGEDSRCKEMKRSMDCKKILMPKAKRRTPLKKAPSNCARCPPKERPCEESPFSEI